MAWCLNQRILSSVIFFLSVSLCLLANHSSIAEKLPRFEHHLKPQQQSLNFLVVGDWGRKGNYNQSLVAHQDSRHVGAYVRTTPAETWGLWGYKRISLGGRIVLFNSVLNVISVFYMSFLKMSVHIWKKMGIVGKNLNIEFVISTGDNFYDDGLKGVDDPAFYESFVDIYTAPSLQQIWYNVLGNHDYRGDVEAQLGPILRQKDSRWVCLRSFILDTDNVEFFFVDTTPFVEEYFTDPGKHTYDWKGVLPLESYRAELLKEVDSALVQSTAKWKIVVAHHPIKSAGPHGNTQELVEQLLPILKSNNVDAYINGHDHCLEHIIDKESGIHFFTSGGGSKAWGGDIKPWDPKELKLYHDGQGFMSMQISKTNASIVFYDVFGKVLHTWSMSKKLKEAA